MVIIVVGAVQAVDGTHWMGRKCTSVTSCASEPTTGICVLVCMRASRGRDAYARWIQSNFPLIGSLSALWNPRNLFRRIIFSFQIQIIVDRADGGSMWVWFIDIVNDTTWTVCVNCGKKQVLSSPERGRRGEKRLHRHGQNTYRVRTAFVFFSLFESSLYRHRRRLHFQRSIDAKHLPVIASTFSCAAKYVINETKQTTDRRSVVAKRSKWTSGEKRAHTLKMMSFLCDFCFHSVVHYGKWQRCQRQPIDPNGSVDATPYLTLWCAQIDNEQNKIGKTYR